ncbi:MAG: thioredoxin family protein [Bacteroidia bacterium]|nr:thioredoxin family protein [Bacteroidia bacterium]
MKTTIFEDLALVVLLTACKSEVKYNLSEPYEDTVILVGPANLEGFQQEPFSEWYNQNYSDYNVNDSLASLVKSNLKSVKIKAFLGTWCEDSQREIPNFIKILKHIDFNSKDLDIVAVNREKKTPQGLENNLNIINVPTFIFYKNGEEINRIVEYPLESLEQDMLKILTNQNYEHAYFGFEETE